MRYRCALLLALPALLTTPGAGAGVEALATVQSWVQFGSQPRQFQADPADGRLRQRPGFSVEAAVTNFTSGTDALGNTVGSTANGSIGLFGGQPFADLLTTGNPGTFNHILAGSFLNLGGTLVGTPGSSGRIDLSGSFLAQIAFQGALLPWAEADVSYHLALVVSGPGQAACPHQRCERRVDYRADLSGGAVPVGPLGGSYALALDASVGDRIEIFIGFGGEVANGYWVVAQPPALPSFAGARSFSSASAAPASRVIDSLRLGGGLGLSPDTGLVQAADGSWALPAAPVPEPATTLLMLAGLAALLVRRRRAVRTAACGLALCMVAGAQAGVQSAVSSLTRVQAGAAPIRVLSDPADRPLRWADGFTVASGIEDFTSATDPWSGALLGATARARMSFEIGQPRLELLTESDTGASFYPNPFSYAEAGGVLTITGSLTGTPGTRGLLTFDGSFAAAVAPSARPPGRNYGAEVDFIAGLVLTGPGQAACPAQRCAASARMNERFDNGSLPAGGLSKPYALSLEASVGDRFELTFTVAATASNGYFVLIGPPAGVPLSGRAALDASASFAGIGGVRLSHGLGLSADSGLELQPDGRWVPPSPVPEPAAAWLLAAGLGLLWLRRRGA